VISGLTLLALVAAVLCGLVLGWGAFGFTYLMSGGSDLAAWCAGILIGLLAAFGGWELVMYLGTHSFSVTPT
jgi:ABC-type uncharacterized transport system permease subunit